MITSIILAFIPCISISADRNPENGSAIDCGVRALYSLFQIENHPISLDRLLVSLPERDPKGYSISELSKCAEANGMNVKAIQLDKSQFPLNRPMIVLYLIRDQGHYRRSRHNRTLANRLVPIKPRKKTIVHDFESKTALSARYEPPGSS